MSAWGCARCGEEAYLLVHPDANDKRKLCIPCVRLEAADEALERAAQEADKVRRDAVRPGGQDAFSMARNGARGEAAKEIATAIRALKDGGK